jgi:hypothetical protein
MVRLTIEIYYNMNMVETDMYGDQLPTPILTHAGNCIADHFALSAFQPVCRFG